MLLHQIKFESYKYFTIKNKLSMSRHGPEKTHVLYLSLKLFNGQT